MIAASAAGKGRGRRGIAWLALLALVLNLAVPGLALRAAPVGALLAGAICHAPGGERAPDQAPEQAPLACPFCAVLAHPGLPALPATSPALPLPRLALRHPPRAPPAAAVLAGMVLPPGARGPPGLV